MNEDIIKIFNDKGKEVKPAVRFVNSKEEAAVKAVSFLENNINGTTKFAITRLTDGGKWMRGKMLFYSLNGVEIYTDAKNIIFVDTTNNILFIREHEKVIQEVSPEDPEKRQYIVLYTDLGFNEDGGNLAEFPLRWESIIGRRNVYEDIKINAPVIDIDRSLVLVENVALKDSLTVRQFMEHLKNADIINEENFDINDYSGGDYN